MTKDRYYITTPIYYVNDRPHIGHAYTSVACDAMARFMRLDGRKVKFLTGTDEHGQKVEKSAKAAGKDPQAFTDEVSQHFREMTKLLNLSNDDFIRTTEPRHKACAQAVWKRMAERKAPDGSPNIYLANYGGWYAVRDEAFYMESELVNGKAPTGADVEWVEEPSYFFALSKYQDTLLKFYEENKDFIGPESRRNEVISFVKSGLKDLSISRTSFKWGIPVPGDEAHIMYVWLDALTNYLSATGFPDENAADYKNFWPADLHVIGKDILRFHAVYWPAFLMAADIALPKRVFANGWWTVDGQKISKSLGNVVDPVALISEFGLDQTRYFLLREVPFGNDGNFSRERMITVVNSELANTIGNLSQRVLSMIQKNCEGKVPGYVQVQLRDIDREFLERFLVTDKTTPDAVRAQYHDCRFHEIIGALVNMAAAANEYIDKQAPWTLKKTDPALMNAVLYYLAEGIRCLAIFLQPYMPQASASILDQLAVPQDQRLFTHAYNFEFKQSGKLNDFSLKPGTPLPPPAIVFPKFVEAKEETK